MIQRWMVKYLRRKGWIVFWLDKEQRGCSAVRLGVRGVCWINEYISGEYIHKGESS